MGEVLPFIKPEERRKLESQLEYWEQVHSDNVTAYEVSYQQVEAIKRKLGRLGIERGIEHS